MAMILARVVFPTPGGPQKIIEDILAGIDQEKNTCIVIENRREAIQQAMDIGKKHDIIVTQQVTKQKKNTRKVTAKGGIIC